MKQVDKVDPFHTRIYYHIVLHVCVHIPLFLEL